MRALLAELTKDLDVEAKGVAGEVKLWLGP